MSGNKQVLTGSINAIASNSSSPGRKVDIHVCIILFVRKFGSLVVCPCDCPQPSYKSLPIVFKLYAYMYMYMYIYLQLLRWLSVGKEQPRTKCQHSDQNREDTAHRHTGLCVCVCVSEEGVVVK